MKQLSYEELEPYWQNGSLDENRLLRHYCSFCGLYDGEFVDGCIATTVQHPEFEVMAAATPDDWSEPFLRGWDYIASYEPVSFVDELYRSMARC